MKFEVVEDRKMKVRCGDANLDPGLASNFVQRGLKVCEGLDLQHTIQVKTRIVWHTDFATGKSRVQIGATPS